MVNNAHVTKTDIAASNGVIHVIDTVLFPNDGECMNLLTGATGYIGGRLLGRLERKVGRQMLVPEPGGAARARGPRLRSGSGGPAPAGISGPGIFRRGHGFLPGSLDAVRAGVREAGKRGGSELCAGGARKPECGRIIYLGGLAHGGELSPHMRSRAGNGQHSALERRSGDRVAGVHRDRFGQRFV